MFDAVIIGGGPAGLSAAVTLRARNKSVAVISEDMTQSGLYKAKAIPNYIGFPDISGAELLEKMHGHAVSAGAEFLSGKALTCMAGKTFAVSYGTEFTEGRSLILATGIVQTEQFPGEAEYLGRGVSYCATCDGMLYRGRPVVCVCLFPGAEKEAAHLESIGCIVTRVTSKDIAINGSFAVDSVTVGGETIPCDCVFIMRRTIAPGTLLGGLEVENGHIRADRDMKTNIPGVFACGDCTGTPYQIGKAVGEGVTAALSAAEYMDK